ncbi:MAG: hypothetical protein M1823_004039 [Watsoniomyces obsoletus]|nr:MAG: hypothetical protein M1823_004039 [Watsoniomyces obsoletus]
MSFRSLLDKTTTLLKSTLNNATPSATKSLTTATFNSSNTTTAATLETLFPRVTPTIDGPNCLEDCASCTISYPRSFKINSEDELYGNIKPWTSHVLIATGKSDWARDVTTEETGSVMMALGSNRDARPKNGRMMISASNMLPPKEYDDTSSEDIHNRPTTVLVLPSFTFVEKVTPNDVEELVRRFVDTPPPTRPSSSSSSVNRDVLNGDTTFPDTAPPSNTVSSSNSAVPTTSEKEESFLTIDSTPSPPPPEKLTSRPCPHAYIILLCSQSTRDARCGQSAPLLRREFERHLRPLGLQRDLDDDEHREGGVGIYFISHVGGHKYAANVIVYRKEDQQAIWLARVRPEDCEAIVKFTVLKGKVVHPGRQLRGGFDRGRGVTSW